MQLLNLARRITLIKYILCTLPLYQFKSIQSLAGIQKIIELIIRRFLWQGGKIEKKKISLVSWKKVIAPYDKGGISIRHPVLMNTTLGDKIVWRLITRETSWWKKVLEHKYISTPHHQLLTSQIPKIPSSQIWKLWKKALPLIQANTFRIIGGGQEIKIWMDRILHKPPLSSHQTFNLFVGIIMHVLS